MNLIAILAFFLLVSVTAADDEGDKNCTEGSGSSLVELITKLASSKGDDNEDELTPVNDNSTQPGVEPRRRRPKPSTKRTKRPTRTTRRPTRTTKRPTRTTRRPTKTTRRSTRTTRRSTRTTRRPTKTTRRPTKTTRRPTKITTTRRKSTTRRHQTTTKKKNTSTSGQQSTTRGKRTSTKDRTRGTKSTTLGSTTKIRRTKSTTTKGDSRKPKTTEDDHSKNSETTQRWRTTTEKEQGREKDSGVRIKIKPPDLTINVGHTATEKPEPKTTEEPKQPRDPVPPVPYPAPPVPYPAPPVPYPAPPVPYPAPPIPPAPAPEETTTTEKPTERRSEKLCEFFKYLNTESNYQTRESWIQDNFEEPEKTILTDALCNSTALAISERMFVKLDDKCSL